MKSTYQQIACLAVVLFFAACQKDNYAPPKSKLTGAITYKGDTIRVASQQVTFELWQSGFGKLTAIKVNVAQDGSFSALLFDGDYKLDFPSGQGPFMSDKINSKDNSDTLAVQVAGNTSVDLEVMPYYLIRTPQFSISGKTVTGSCALEKIITDANARDVESVTLYLNKTSFVDNNNNIASTSVAGADIADPASITLHADVPDMVPTQGYVFARIGLKIKNVEDMMFSPVVKVSIP
jgi:hypothetical protein